MITEKTATKKERNDALRLIRKANEFGIGVSLYEGKLSLYGSGGFDDQRYRFYVVPILKKKTAAVAVLKGLDIENEKLVWWFIYYGQNLVPKRAFSIFDSRFDDPEHFKNDLLSKIYQDEKSYKENSNFVAYQIRCFKNSLKNGELYVQHPQIRTDDLIQFECRVFMTKEVVDAMCAGVDPEERAEFEFRWYAERSFLSAKEFSELS